MDEMTDAQIGDETVALANEIQAVLAGRSTVAGYIAIGMVLGYSESLAKRPDLDSLMQKIKVVAAGELERARHG